MGLLSGSVSMTRLTATTKPEAIDFEAHRFEAISPGSEIRVSKGFMPMEPGGDYEFTNGRLAFRVRIDTRKPCSVQVKERVESLVAVEFETGAEVVGTKRRKELRELAEEEVLDGTSPTSRIVEGVIDGGVITLGTTSSPLISEVLALLRAVGVEAVPLVPWGDEVMDLSGVKLKPGQSAHGSYFLDSLDGAGRELIIDPEGGHAKIVTPSTTMTLRGDILVDLEKHPERHILSAKLAVGEQRFKLDGLSWQVGGLSIETGRHDHWTERLDERMEKLDALWDLLGREYAASLEREEKKSAVDTDAAQVHAILVEAGERRDMATVESWSGEDRAKAAQWARGTLRLPVMPECLTVPERAESGGLERPVPGAVKLAVWDDGDVDDGVPWSYLVEELCDDDAGLAHAMLNSGELHRVESGGIQADGPDMSLDVDRMISLANDGATDANNGLDTQEWIPGSTLTRIRLPEAIKPDVLGRVLDPPSGPEMGDFLAEGADDPEDRNVIEAVHELVKAGEIEAFAIKSAPDRIRHWPPIATLSTPGLRKVYELTTGKIIGLAPDSDLVEAINEQRVAAGTAA